MPFAKRLGQYDIGVTTSGKCKISGITRDNDGATELTTIWRQAGAVFESGVMTPISSDYFTNFSEAYVKH